MGLGGASHSVALPQRSRRLSHQRWEHSEGEGIGATSHPSRDEGEAGPMQTLWMWGRWRDAGQMATTAAAAAAMRAAHTAIRRMCGVSSAVGRGKQCTSKLDTKTAPKVVGQWAMSALKALCRKPVTSVDSGMVEGGDMLIPSCAGMEEGGGIWFWFWRTAKMVYLLCRTTL